MSNKAKYFIANFMILLDQKGIYDFVKKAFSRRLFFQKTWVIGI